MKLEKLYVQEYRVLKDLTIYFSRGAPVEPNPQSGYTLDFLVGVNGTGKSTVLQLLGRIFNALQQADSFPIPFELVYVLGNQDDQNLRRITITNVPQRADGESAEDAAISRFYYQQQALSKLEDDEATIHGLSWQRGRLPDNALPELVVIYTTGSERDWYSHLVAEEGSVSSKQTQEGQGEVQAIEQPGHRPNLAVFDDDDNEPAPSANTLFIQSSRLALVALCGLVASERRQQSQPPGANTSPVLKPVFDALRLEPLSGFSLRIRSHQNLTPPTQQEIIENLEACSDSTLEQGADKLLIFDMNRQFDKLKASTGSSQPSSILALYSSPIILFRNLHRLYDHKPFYDPPLQEVNLFFKRVCSSNANSDADDNTQPQSMLQLFDWLSDGERSFLARMALFALFQADGLLILLDEPEVHFNDVWKREIVHTLDQIMTGHASHALITTHSSIALTDVPSKDVIVLRRENGRTTDDDSQELKFQTFGADPSDIMIHVFGTDSARGEHSTRFIRRMIGQSNTAAELDELSAIVAPGYWRYRIQLEKARVGHLN